LLTKPQELPDDDDETSPEEQADPATSAPVAAVYTVTDHAPSVPPTMPTQSVAPEEEREPAQEPPQVKEAKQSPAKKPPGTLRLNEVAGSQLWDAFLEAKDADPFLSYRKFASDVILDGLATRRRRQKRA
jgi:cell pole-organizing protein PopZ